MAMMFVDWSRQVRLPDKMGGDLFWGCVTVAQPTSLCAAYRVKDQGGKWSAGLEARERRPTRQHRERSWWREVGAIRRTGVLISISILAARHRRSGKCSLWGAAHTRTISDTLREYGERVFLVSVV
ncbi:hypothetical protein ACFQ3P_06795 [Paraburkholderia sabiae]|uniref:Uncharacterized protein n=1 Tax=Paraburkholderia sabiae TaxID=273251 RepID=A0ABU9QKX2_9BURK|nr:hypothetical protein [Paraburkholderia sabiae]WJZ76479.1 hypothetical protein QEN71_11980 [Paraburkholderia sabiae]CAD6560180.1 hypothetical protein LMG24235_06866 [Paraburkholderia sabiae]